MRIRRIAATTLTLAAIGGGVALTSGAANAATITCKTTTTHHHSVTAKGTVSDYVLHKSGCGKNYVETETGTSRSVTGAHSQFTWRKVEIYPTWTKHEVRESWTAKGTETTTVTNSSGG